MPGCRAAVAVALLALAGCKTAPERVVVPEVVKVPVTEYVRVPDSLTEPCVSPELKERTVEAVVAAANARKVCEDRLNDQMRQIRKLGQ